MNENEQSPCSNKRREEFFKAVAIPQEFALPQDKNLSNHLLFLRSSHFSISSFWCSLK